MDPHELGRRAEEVAAGYLEARGWVILDRNYRAGRKEVDLVARRGDLVAFVEVKARRGPACGHPLEAITRRKRGDLAAVARQWLAERREFVPSVRFDAVAVLARDGERWLVHHVPDAWRLD